MLKELRLKEDRALSYNAMARTKQTAIIFHLQINRRLHFCKSGDI